MQGREARTRTTEHHTPSIIPLTYRDGRKRIINELGKFESSSTLDRLITELRSAETNDLQRMRSRPPWRTLLLLHWFLERGHYSAARLRPMSERDLAKLLNGVAALEGALELPSQHPDFNVFLRKIAYQQFWFQERPQIAHFARQSLLFRELPNEHPLASAFARVIGVPIGEFIAVLVAMTIPLAVRNVSVGRQFFSTLEPFFSRTTVDGVLATISKDREGLRDYLRSNQHPDARAHYEYYSRTPLTRYPLLRDGDLFIPYATTVLARGAETLVYDVLRNDDPSTFMNHFGPLFESYVRRGIEHVGFPFMDEPELKQRFGKGKVVDFAFHSPNGTLLIDAKGVELPVGAMVTTDTEFLSTRLKTSVFKR